MMTVADELVLILGDDVSKLNVKFVVVYRAALHCEE